MLTHGRTWRLTEVHKGMSSTLAWLGLKTSSGRLRRRSLLAGRIASHHLHPTAPSPAPPVAQSARPASVCTATADDALTPAQIHDLLRSMDADVGYVQHNTTIYLTVVGFHLRYGYLNWRVWSITHSKYSNGLQSTFLIFLFAVPKLIGYANQNRPSPHYMYLLAWTTR